VTELGSSVDELERLGSLLEILPRSVGHQTLSEGHDALLDTGARSLDEDEIVCHDSVVNEASQRCNGFLGDIEVGGTIRLIGSFADTVDFLVDLRSAMVTVLTGTGNTEHDLAGMPRSDTCDLSEALVRFAWELLCSPSVRYTLESVTLGDSKNVNVLICLEHRGDIDCLLEVGLCKLDLVGDRATVDLDLCQVCLLLAQTSLADLGVRKNADDCAVFADSLQLPRYALSLCLCVLGGVLCECLFLALVPVLVEPTLDLVAEVLGPDSGQRAETTRSLDVSDNTDDNHRRGLDDSGCLDDFLLVHFGSNTLELSDDVGHTSLVAEEGGKVDGLLWVILGEGLDTTTVGSSSLLWQEAERTVTGVFEFPVRHLEGERGSYSDAEKSVGILKTRRIR